MSEADDGPVHVAVTGAAGYIGSRVVHGLQEAYSEWELTALDNFYLGDVREIGDVAVEHVDVRHRDELEQALEGADLVMHLAAVSGVDDCDENPDLSYDVNIGGTNNVAGFCRQTGAGLIFPFSMASIGDPESFPITVDHPRDPMNWYGRSKVLGERAIETFAEGAFPAHLLMKSNLYGAHEIDGQTVSKGTVVNFFVGRARAGETLTAYAPGTQSRNFVHVKDVARAYVRSAERLVEQLAAGETGVQKYEIASDEDPSVKTVAEQVRGVASETLGRDVNVEVVENPRGNETLVSEFTVETTRARERLGWEPTHSVAESVRDLVAGE